MERRILGWFFINMLVESSQEIVMQIRQLALIISVLLVVCVSILVTRQSRGAQANKGVSLDPQLRSSFEHWFNLQQKQLGYKKFQLNCMLRRIKHLLYIVRISMQKILHTILCCIPKQRILKSISTLLEKGDAKRNVGGTHNFPRASCRHMD